MKTEVWILGGGSAGYTCALQCARKGLKTVLIENDTLGGTGLRWGCLPVKGLMDWIRLAKTATDPGHGGIAGQNALPPDLAASILSANRSAMETVSRRMAEDLLQAGVEVIIGSPSLRNLHQCRIMDRIIEFQYLVLATGTETMPLEGIIPDGCQILTHRNVVSLEVPPESLLILGGDVEGLEFASLFSEMGTRVTVLDMVPRFLEGLDEDLKEPLFQRLEKNGVICRPGTRIVRGETLAQGVRLTAADGTTYEGERVLLAMARRPVLPEGFDRLELALVRDRVPVDQNTCTRQPHIFCIGDLNGRMEMAHTAQQQGYFLADYLATGVDVAWDYGPLPRAMFTLPQNGGAGLLEKELQAAGTPYRTAKVHWADTWRGAGQADVEGFLKVLSGEDGTLLGVWMTGWEISEQIGLLGLAIQRRLTLDELKRQLWVHPTRSEALLQAILALENGKGGCRQ